MTKTADCPEISPCGTAGYTVTITNTGTTTAAGITLSDALPAGKGADIKWTIDLGKRDGSGHDPQRLHDQRIGRQ